MSRQHSRTRQQNQLSWRQTSASLSIRRSNVVDIPIDDTRDTRESERDNNKQQHTLVPDTIHIHTYTSHRSVVLYCRTMREETLPIKASFPSLSLSRDRGDKYRVVKCGTVWWDTSRWRDHRSISGMDGQLPPPLPSPIAHHHRPSSSPSTCQPLPTILFHSIHTVGILVVSRLVVVP